MLGVSTQYNCFWSGCPIILGEISSILDNNWSALTRFISRGKLFKWIEKSTKIFWGCLIASPIYVTFLALTLRWLRWVVEMWACRKHQRHAQPLFKATSVCVLQAGVLPIPFLPVRVVIIRCDNTIPTSKSSNHKVWYYLLLRNLEPQIEVPQMRESCSWGIAIENTRNVTSLQCPTDELSYLGSSPLGHPQKKTIWSLN